MTLKVLFADDEPQSRQKLRKFLDSEPGVEVVAECRNGPETLKAIRRKAPDLVILDLGLEGKNGFQVIDSLSDKHAPAIILVSAHERFALKAFEAEAIDYVLKPYNGERMRKALQKARKSVRLKGVARNGAERTVAENGRIAIRSGKRIIFVKPNDIEWVQSADNYSELHVGESAHLLRKTLGTLEKQLPSERFLRISRSILVNVDFVHEIRSRTHGDYSVVMHDGTQLSGTRNHRQKLFKVMATAS